MTRSQTVAIIRAGIGGLHLVAMFAGTRAVFIGLLGVLAVVRADLSVSG